MGGPENFKVIRELADVLGCRRGVRAASIRAGFLTTSSGTDGADRSAKIYIAVESLVPFSTGGDENIGYHCRHQQGCRSSHF